MTLASRERISVDLQGLKAALLGRARDLGVSPSVVVRESLAGVLGTSRALVAERLERGHANDRVRLSLRMRREEALAVFQGARSARTSPGDYVANLAAGVPALAAGTGRHEHLAALIASNAELSTLSRNIHHLTALLRQGAVRPAQEYRAMLDTLADDVRRHLLLASSVLADLRPRHGAPLRTNRPAAESPETRNV